MKNRKIVHSALFILGLLLVHCARNKGNPVGAAFFQRENMGAEIHVRYQPVVEDTSFKAFVNTEVSPYLFLGELANFTSKILLLFSVLPPDSAVVDSARVTLHAENVIGERTGNFTATVHPILNAWNTVDVTWETFTDEMIGEPVATLEISADDIDASGDSLAYTFDLPVDLVQSWIDSTTSDDNHGIVLCPAPSDFIVDFTADENTTVDNGPSLYLRYTTDTVRTGFYTAAADLFLADTEKTPAADILHVGNGSAHHTFVLLDLDTIPDEAAINRALLTFVLDTTLSFPDHSDPFAATIFPAMEEEWTPPLLNIDSAYASTAGVFGDTLVFNLTSLVQDWTAGIRENHGFLMVGNSETINLNQRVLYSSEADPALRPRMQIHYSLPPSSKY